MTTRARLLLLGGAAACAAIAFAPEPRVPGYAEVRAAWSPSDVRIFDRHGEVLHEIRVNPDVRRLEWTALEDVSPALVRAVVESEDRRFESHAGIDWHAVAAASFQSLGGGPARGASTITMQLAALVDPSLRRGAGPRGLVAKLRQMRAASALEEGWSKREILEAYLNLVGFRGEVEGVRAAAETVFGKAPHGLTVEESAALAASIRSPGAPEEALLARTRNLLSRLGSTDGEAGAAAAVRLAGAPANRGSRRALIPHASRLLLRDAPGHDVRSSIDAGTQVHATAALRRHVLEIRDRSASDGAVLVVDNESGEVLAYVGSSAELSTAREVDGVRAPRQAGSTLKPFLYARAIDDGLVTAATLLEDTPLEIAVGDTVYRPENYDHQFRGLVPLRTALAASLNVPAVRTLTLLGEEKLAETLRRLRIQGVSESGDWYGPSLALGSVDVTLWDLVGAYRALARGGVWSPLRFGPEAQPADASNRVFDASTAWIVGDMLADRASRTATFRLDGPLSTRYWTAVKTGTSKDMRDNWCVGFSSRFTVGVWVGNFSGEPMRDVSGTTGAAPIWREVMDALHEDVASEQPAAPDGVVRAAFSNSGSTAHDFFRRGTEPIEAMAGLEHRVRIAYPTGGSTIAIDPDMPANRQRIALEARPRNGDLTWTLDGRPLASAARPFLWMPVPGKHRLELLDRNGRRLDAVRFEVRGQAIRQATGFPQEARDATVPSP